MCVREQIKTSLHNIFPLFAGGLPHVVRLHPDHGASAAAAAGPPQAQPAGQRVHAPGLPQGPLRKDLGKSMPTRVPRVVCAGALGSQSVGIGVTLLSYCSGWHLRFWWQL